MCCSGLRWTMFGAALGVCAFVGWSHGTRANAADSESKKTLTAGFKAGAPDYKSIGQLTFSPSGVLFYADDQAGAVYGVDLGEKASKAASFARVPDLGATIAAKMGTTATGIMVRDMAISPVSHNVYLSVRKTDGADQNPANPANYALFSVDPAGKVSAVDLAKLPFGRVAIAGKPNKPYFGTETRIISDIAYAKGRVLVGALSGDAFKSNLVSVPVPFKQDGGVEAYATSIYHISHKKQETASPIETLTIYRDGDREYLMAAYVCTPVVRFNLDDLKPNQVVNGATVAELGSGNRPLDMVAYGKPGEQSLLLNNHALGIVKVAPGIAKEATAVNEAAKADRGSRGKTPFPGIDNVDALKGTTAFAADGARVLAVMPGANGVTLEPVTP